MHANKLQKSMSVFGMYDLRMPEGFPVLFVTSPISVESFFQVAGRVLSRTFDMIGQDISACVLADSTVFNPRFEFRQEFRQPNMPPTSTLLLKVNISSDAVNLFARIFYWTSKIQS
jgi:hypothetical protein